MKTDLSTPRRRILHGLAGGVPALATALTLGGGTKALHAAQPDALDLVIRGGRVIDPAQNLSAVMDIGIRNGKIARIESTISASVATPSYDASGKIVTPGLIDMHGHVADSMMPVSIDPDIAGLPTGVTTFVDAGSAGARTFAGFRKHVIKRAETRIYTLLNISNVGLVVLNELYLDPKMISVKGALRTIRENRDLIVGIKARVRGRKETLSHDIEIMKKVREVADETGLPVMMHWTNEPELLATLKRGDLMTHPFNPAYLNPSCVDANGKIYPQILELPERGIGVELGHGSSFDWNIAERAAGQGWFPDVLSTDVFTRYFKPKGVVGDLPAVMSKFLLLGLSLEQVIEKTTLGPTRLIPLPEQLGTLKPGAIADLTVLLEQQGEFTFTDSPRLLQQRVGKRLLGTVATIKSGRLYDYAT